MLRWTHIARFASKHSPEREQRLLSFAGVPPPADASKPDDEKARILPFSTKNIDTEAALSSGDVTLTERQRFNDAIFKAVMPDDQRRVLEEFRPEIEKHMGTVETPTSNQDLDEVIELTRLSIVDELNREERERNELARALQTIDTSITSDSEIRDILELHQELISRYFKLSPNFDPKHAVNLLQALLFKDIERIRAMEHQRETGIKWSFLKAPEFDELFRKTKKIPSDKQIKTPNAFTYENTMYFNSEDADFIDESSGTVNAQRAVTHEATHLALRAAEPQYSLESWKNTLRSHPDWKKLVAAVEVVYKNDPAYLEETGSRNNRIVDEALAIYIANTRHPAPPELANQESYIAQQKVCAILGGIFARPKTGFTKMLKDDLEARVDRFLEVKTRNDNTGNKTVGTMLSSATDEVKVQRRVYDLAMSRKIKNASGQETAANPDEGKAFAMEDLDDAKEKGANEKSPEALLALQQKVGSKLKNIRSNYPLIRQKVQAEKIDDKTKKEALAIIDQNLTWIGQQQDDLLVIQRSMNAIQDAESKLTEPLSVGAKKALHETCIPGGPNPYAHLTDASPEADIAAADAKFEANRKELLDIAHEVLTQSERIASRIEKGTKVPEEASTHGTEEAGGMMNWLRKNVWGPDSNIVWMTPLNIMNVIKIYKEAIVENYSSNQKIKENRFAKEMNFYKPIQHTLNKQARSSNEKETSEFKEYIEREGFTFEDVFGKDGRGLSTGLLFENRHNFNRAKAVILYAADHAWLYFMDRLHGNDVYGINYEAIEGHQSFEELVSQHEAGKSKQIDHGVERVDKDPDVPPMMDAMVHELRQKNIFVVQGIMQRLQDKAKYSHSNTWMLTTLLMLIRDECVKDPTLKFCLDKGMIDNIANHTIVQSAWSITWLKMLRHDIDGWKQKPGSEGFDNNVLTKTMVKIESMLADYGAEFPNTDEGKMAKYEAIAMILAGKTFSADNEEVIERKLLRFGKWKQGKSISLFQNVKQFNDYREAFSSYTSQSTCDPKKTDNDYFNAENDGSDVMLVNQTGYEKLLIKDSTGKWTNAEKVPGFMAQIFERYDDLGIHDPEAQKQYAKEVSEKLSYWWLNTDDSRKNEFHENRDQRNRLLFEEILKRGLYTDRAMLNLRKTLDKGYLNSFPPEKKDEQKKYLDDLFTTAKHKRALLQGPMAVAA